MVTLPLYPAASDSSFYTFNRFVRATCLDSAFVFAVKPGTPRREPLLSANFQRQISCRQLPSSQIHHGRRVDVEEDVQDLSRFLPDLHPLETVVLLLCPE